MARHTDPTGEWVSWAETAQMTGCPVHVIEWWKREERIAHRPHTGNRATLRRSPVEEFATWYRVRKVARSA